MPRWQFPYYFLFHKTWTELNKHATIASSLFILLCYLVGQNCHAFRKWQRERCNKPRKAEDATWLLREVSDTDVTEKPFVTNRFIGKAWAMSQADILQSVWSRVPGVSTPHWPAWPEWPSLRIKKWKLEGRINGKQTPTDNWRNFLHGICPSNFVCLPWGSQAIRSFQSTYDCLTGSFLPISVVGTAPKMIMHTNGNASLASHYESKHCTF